MSDKPILFSGPEVRAILGGKKSQTRRVIKPQLGPKAEWVRWEGLCWLANGLIGDIPKKWRSRILYPKYQPGDRLFVRESFYIDLIPWDSGPLRPMDYVDEIEAKQHIYYRADGECCQQIPECACAEVGKPKWHPSIHMPRWASRLTLEATGVRVERLQEISEADAIAEGIERCDLDIRAVQSELVNHSMECDRFARLWDSINGKTHPWESNPWVWVYEFRRVEE